MKKKGRVKQLKVPSSRFRHGRLLLLFSIVLAGIVISGCVISQKQLEPELYGVVTNPLPDEITGERDAPWAGGTLRLTPMRQDPGTKQWVPTGEAPLQADLDEAGRYVVPQVRVGNYKFEFVGPDDIQYLDMIDSVRIAPRTNNRYEKNLSITRRAKIKVEGENLTDRVVFGTGHPGITQPDWLHGVARLDPDVDEGPYFGAQDMAWYNPPAGKPPMSGGWHAFLYAGAIGSVAEGTFTLSENAAPLMYTVKYAALGAENYGVTRLTIDGVVLGDFDLFSPFITTHEFEGIGPIQLGPGEHVVRLEIVASNTEKSFPDGIGIALDYLEFVQAD